MITHILRMIWNRKQANLLLLLEMLLCSIVLFLVLSQVLHGLRKALEPLGFDYHNVLVLDIRTASDDPMLNNLRLQEVLEFCAGNRKLNPPGRCAHALYPFHLADLVR
jgi:putative ABC transport system permease protein